MYLLRVRVFIRFGLGFGFRGFQLGFLALPTVLGVVSLIHLGLGFLVLASFFLSFVAVSLALSSLLNCTQLPILAKDLTLRIARSVIEPP